MKSASKLVLFLGVLTLATGVCASDRLFTVVPTGDATYDQIARLETLGLLPQGASRVGLTRYEVAQLIFKARGNYEEKYGGMRLAQAEIPPPPDEGSDAAPSPAASNATGPAEVDPVTGNTVSSNPDAAPVVTTAPAPGASSASGQASRVIGSLEEGYQEELKALKGDVQKVSDRAKKDEDEQFKLWRRIRAIDTGAAIYLHGLGRAFTYSNARTGDVLPPQHAHSQNSYLDMNPCGIVSKEVSWSAVFRIASDMAPQTSNDLFTMRRATLRFSPAWIDSTLGDFEESYTPLTLWNRRFADLRFYPDLLDRNVRYRNYEGFLDHDGYLPFRGVRVGTAVMWPKSDVLDSLKVSTFAHMVNSGFVNGAFLPHNYTGWIFGGRTAFEAREYFSVDAQGVMLDEPMDTDDPGSAYQQFDPSSWAQRYQIGSIRPDLHYPLSNDFTLGLRYEMAYSIYQDDKRDAAKKVEDYAKLGGPYVRYGKYSLQFNLVDNGSDFYSPLSQYRQEGVTAFPGILQVTRASAFFAAYNRLTDNVFPYGLASPNRKGGGIEADLKALRDDAFAMKASFYQLHENSGNFVMNVFGSGYDPVDRPDSLGNSPAAVRKFTYVNVGPVMNLAPFLNLPNVLEIGLNFRSEKTESWIGQLKSDQMLGQIRGGIASWWEISVYGQSSASKGRESFLEGTEARYRYRFDNTDLGGYDIVNLDTKFKEIGAGTKFTLNRNSVLILDGWTNEGTMSYPDYSTTSAKVKNGGGRLVYEIVF